MTESLKITSRGIKDNKTLLSETSRAKLFKFLQLEEGNWLITRAKDKSYKKSRYRYYFGHVLLTAVTSFNRREMFQIEHEDTGEMEQLTTEDLHERFKWYFNPQIVRYESMRIIKKGSTKKLSDEAFIKEYMEKIFHWLAEHEVIVLNYEEWRKLAESKEFTSQEIADEAIEKQLVEFKDHS